MVQCVGAPENFAEESLHTIDILIDASLFVTV